MQDQFKVVSAAKERLHVRVFHEFLSSNLLSGEEKLIYILLKRYVDFRFDTGTVYPTIKTLCDQTGWCHQRVEKYIKSLKSKGIIKVTRQGLNKPNIYTLFDHPGIWESKTVEEFKIAAEETELEKALRIVRESGIYDIKKKEPVSSTDQSNDADPIKNLNNQIIEENYNKKVEKSQYSIEDIKYILKYEEIINSLTDFSDSGLLDSIFQVIYNTVIGNRKYYKIKGSDIPADIVKSQLLKLSTDDILYAIYKFKGVKERITNPDAYLLSILYGAKKDGELDIINQVNHDLYGYD